MRKGKTRKNCKKSESKNGSKTRNNIKRKNGKKYGGTIENMDRNCFFIFGTPKNGEYGLSICFWFNFIPYITRRKVIDTRKVNDPINNYLNNLTLTSKGPAYEYNTDNTETKSN